MKVKMIINYLAIFSFITWWGGFTFYATFVIPTGQRVLGSHVQMGFISEQVTSQINYAALIACLLLLLNEWIRNGMRSILIKPFAILMLLSMLAIVLVLFYMHPFLSALLDHENKKVIDHDHFYFLHRIYLILSSVLWLLGIIYTVSFFKKAHITEPSGQA